MSAVIAAKPEAHAEALHHREVSLLPSIVLRDGVPAHGAQGTAAITELQHYGLGSPRRPTPGLGQARDHGRHCLRGGEPYEVVLGWGVRRQDMTMPMTTRL